MKVRDFMETDVISIETKTSIMEAQNIMWKKNIKRLPVMKKGKLIGLVTKHMLLEASPSSATSLSVFELNYLLSKMTVDDIMVKDPITISPDDPTLLIIKAPKAGTVLQYQYNCSNPEADFEEQMKHIFKGFINVVRK